VSTPAVLAALYTQAASFTYTASVTAQSGNVGSLAGGMPLTLAISGAGLPSASSAPSISVAVAGLPCPVVDGSWTTSQAVCLAPAVPQGFMSAEYWVLPFFAYWVSRPNATPKNLDSFGPPSCK
jgi:hypothetical protein